MASAPFRPRPTIRCGCGTSKPGTASQPSPVRGPCCAARLRRTGERLSQEKNQAEGISCGWKVWTSVLSPKYEVFCCDQNGPPARREEGAYLNRYVTDEQRSLRPIFIATLWAGTSWLFFRVARSTRMIQIWALRSRPEKQPTDRRQNTSYFGDRTLVLASRI